MSTKITNPNDGKNTDTVDVKPDAQAILEEFDRESRQRSFTSRPLAIGLTIFAVVVSLYHMYTAYFGTPPVLIHRSIHVAMILALAFAMYPPVKKASRTKIPFYDVILILLSISTAVYVYLNYDDIVRRAGVATMWDVIMAAVLVLLVLEAARRISGWALPILGVLFVLYAVFGREIPGMFRHRGYSWDATFNFLYLTTEGIYGTAIGVAASYIFLFVLFGAVLQKSGMGQFFNDIALALAGQSRGGPAKVAVVASGFLGSINGAAVANVVTTGAFTIPLMKRVGYKPVFAGAVEASASVGGQILPPIMGAAAFIMAETLGMPYRDIAIAALIPALLYYLGVIAQVHLRATRDGLKGISRENLPAVGEVLKERGHLMIPLLFLIYMLFFTGRTILLSALLTILVTAVVAQLRKTTRMSIQDMIDALADGAKTSVSVSIACAAVGVIVGVVTLTGFGVKLANAIVTIGAGNLLFSLILTMIACIILGMGLPSIPTYIITATMAAPALGQLGVEPLVAHLFVFYFGLFANITPPVALASFAAAGLSGADPVKTGFQSMRLSLAGYIIPFIFVFNPAMLLQDVTAGQAILVAITGTVGVLLLSVAVEGHFMVNANPIVRVLFAAAALTMMAPDLMTDAIGLGIAVVAIAIQCVAAKKQDMLSIRNI
ncbi:MULTISPECIES: TRAP transporter permease [Corynebacterium]|uniref:C4-dicarboxylate ABC transporter permease n=1 Tax=Corynebacterium riegelii TaxID=156976 RepID=A0A0K1R9L4_9CORY|nr:MULTISPECIES: TRAP transporter permease [Corynebacterium]AKV58117.1 C4-dicarboxylate ABC transporter permease [Corynebacterium riegelii]MDK7179271.1 TRAP transporter permease [Corynebacterium riegelii]OFT74078.1 C4-dicarboxylate ABC transporter permease [Corynebacterium sp. HMSC30G07]QQU83842.1 TRAP transporter permease [Corynebacterium riegelii]